LLLRLYDTQHSEEDGVFFCVALIGGVVSHPYS
jgi:hypothetical protein